MEYHCAGELSALCVRVCCQPLALVCCRLGGGVDGQLGAAGGWRRSPGPHLGPVVAPPWAAAALCRGAADPLFLAAWQAPALPKRSAWLFWATENLPAAPGGLANCWSGVGDRWLPGLGLAEEINWVRSGKAAALGWADSGRRGFLPGPPASLARSPRDAASRGAAASQRQWGSARGPLLFSGAGVGRQAKAGVERSASCVPPPSCCCGAPLLAGGD